MSKPAIKTEDDLHVVATRQYKTDAETHVAMQASGMEHGMEAVNLRQEDLLAV